MSSFNTYCPSWREWNSAWCHKKAAERRIARPYCLGYKRQAREEHTRSFANRPGLWYRPPTGSRRRWCRWAGRCRRPTRRRAQSPRASWRASVFWWCCSLCIARCSTGSRTFRAVASTWGSSTRRIWGISLATPAMENRCYTCFSILFISSIRQSKTLLYSDYILNYR